MAHLNRAGDLQGVGEDLGALAAKRGSLLLHTSVNWLICPSSRGTLFGLPRLSRSRAILRPIWVT